jgi:hypothetical protein
MSPRYLYKYGSLDYLSVKIFINRELWFANADDFNDPFEFSIPISFEGTDEQYRKVCSEEIRKGDPSISDEELDKKVSEALKLGNHRNATLLRQLEQEYLADLRREINVCCFSEKRDDILMWSHYADMHRGYCIEFDKNSDFFNTVMKVEYASIYPKLNRFTTPKEKQTSTVVTTKYSEWEYEQEWRILGDHGAHPFTGDCVKGVIFGCKMRNHDKQTMRNVFRNWKSPVQFYEARKKTGEFGLEIIQLD